MIVARREITDALIQALKTGTGRPVGDHAAPPGTPNLNAPFEQRRDGFPYCTVWCIPGGEFTGGMLEGDLADATLAFQVTSVGLRRDQVEWMSDLVRRVVIARNGPEWQVPMVSPSGWKICARLPQEGAGGIETEGHPPLQVFSSAERYTITVTPA